MTLKQIALFVLIGVAVAAAGCSDDGSGTGGSGGTAATGGGGGGDGGNGGTGGMDPDDPCLGQPSCIVCPKEALPPDIAPLLPEGLRVPVDYTATPEGDVVQGGAATIALDAEIMVTLPLPAEGSIKAGSTSSYAAAVGGEGMLDIAIPEQDLSGQVLVIDGGSGAATFDIAADATELVIGMDSVLVNLSVSDPVELELILDASEDGDCRVEGEGVVIPVTPES